MANVHTQSNQIIYSRMMEGSGIGVVTQMEKLKYINKYHCGAHLAVAPSSYILPKGSPLQVYQTQSESFK